MREYSLFLSSVASSAGKVVTTDVAYIGDESGTFYAVNVWDGSLVWAVYLGMTQNSCQDLPYGQFGIGSTAVLDRSAGLVYAMGGNGTFYALSMRDGSVAWSLSLAETVDTSLLRNYGALQLYRNLVFVPFAGFCDNGLYPGQVLSVSVTTKSLWSVFYPARGPSGQFYGGGVWGAGGVTVGAGAQNGSIFFATGNSVTGPSENVNYCDKPVQLRARDLSFLNTVTPDFTLEVGDDDFGATPILFNKDVRFLLRDD